MQQQLTLSAFKVGYAQPWTYMFSENDINFCKVNHMARATDS